jgi:hypothetical protein
MAVRAHWLPMWDKTSQTNLTHVGSLWSDGAYRPVSSAVPCEPIWPFVKPGYQPNKLVKWIN